MRSPWPAALALVTLPALCRALPSGTYTVKDLGTLGGDNSSAYAMNARGDVVGLSDLAGGNARHPFLYRSGTVADLGLPKGYTTATPVDINELGQVIGSAVGPDERPTAVLWADGACKVLGAGTPTAINNRGQIAGTGKFWQSSKDGEILQHVFPGNYYRVTSINDNGIVVGACAVSGRVRRQEQTGFYWMRDASGSPVLGMFKSPRPSMANLINNQGLILGSSPNRETYPFLWQNGRVTYLLPLGVTDAPADGSSEKLLPCQAFAMNNKGEVVGTSFAKDAKRERMRAVIWSDGKAVDLNSLIPASSGWVLLEARGINDYGWICGTGRYNGKTRAFLLAPAAE